MAKKDKLIKSKSIYTIKKQHTVTNNGIIYENDHVTIVPNDGLYDDEMALFSESNFKYKIDTTQSSKKRHNRGEFISILVSFPSLRVYVLSLRVRVQSPFPSLSTMTENPLKSGVIFMPFI